MRIQRAIQCVFLVCLSALPAAFTGGPLEAGDGDTVHLRGRGAAAPGARTAFRSPHIPLINRVAAEEGVDEYLVQCVVKVESDFNAGAVSVAGATGLMQIMLDVARAHGVTDPFDPGQNVRAGVRHLKSLLDSFNGDITLALAAYHAGAGRVKRHGGVPPIKSTVDYVARVLRYYEGGRSRESAARIEYKVRRLYRRIGPDGTIEIYDR